MAGVDAGDLDLPQLPSPEAIMAQQQQQQTALQAQGPQGQNLAAVLNFANILRGNPQLQKAQQLRTAVQGAVANLPSAPADGQDDIDYNIQRVQRMRDAVLPIDPNLANQLNTNILKLTTEKMERARLNATTRELNAQAAAIEQRNDAEPNAVNKAMSNQAYVMDPKSGEVQAFDLSNPANAPAFDKAKSQPGAVILNSTERYQQLQSQIAQKQAMAIAKLRFGAGPGGQIGLDPDTVHDAAIATLSDPKLMSTFVSYGPKGQPYKDAINNEQSRVLKDAGMTASDLTQIRAQIGAEKGNAANMQKQLGNISAYEALAHNNGDRILQLANTLDLGNIPGVGKIPATAAIDLAVQRGMLGMADAAEYKSVLRTFQTEIARIVTAGPTLNGILSDTARSEIADVVPGNLPLPSLTRVINRLFTEMEVRRTGLANQLTDAVRNSSVFQGTGAAFAPRTGAPGETPTTPPAGGNVAPEGTVLYKDGKAALVKRNGQWVNYGQ